MVEYQENISMRNFQPNAQRAPRKTPFYHSCSARARCDTLEAGICAPTPCAHNPAAYPTHPAKMLLQLTCCRIRRLTAPLGCGSLTRRAGRAARCSLRPPTSRVAARHEAPRCSCKQLARKIQAMRRACGRSELSHVLASVTPADALQRPRVIPGLVSAP